MDCPGIYRILNTKENKSYIGGTVNLRVRKNQHFSLLSRRIHKNRFLQEDFDRLGECCFIFEHLVICKPFQIHCLEEKFIEKYNTLENGYNIEKTGCVIKGQKRNPETGNRISIANTGNRQSIETKEKLSKINIGKKLSKETKNKISLANKGRKLSNREVEIIRQRNYGNTYNLGKKRNSETKDKQKQSQIAKIKENNYNGHLNEEAIKVIKFMQKYCNYKGLQTKLSKLYKISKPTLADIKNERTWVHLKI